MNNTPSQAVLHALDELAPEDEQQPSLEAAAAPLHSTVSSQYGGSYAQFCNPGNSSQLAALRAMSVNASLTGVPPGGRAEPAGAPSRAALNVPPRYPAVAVVFVAVEGAEALQQQSSLSTG